ncbi:MAG: hypothetical protein JWN06_3414 [Propionibacteriaceae bacterium]|nr:hypothetical protein [Propionibacteriaceae bacterium]
MFKANELGQPSRRRKATIAAMALALASGGLAVIPTEAAAALPGLHRIFADSVLGSGTPKAVTANCPSAERLVGTGAQVIGASRQILIRAVRPNILASKQATSVTVIADEDATGTSLNWRVRAWAVCAAPPPGLQVRPASSAFNSSSRKDVTATCPAGQSVLGIGATLSSTAGRRASITSLVPSLGLVGADLTAIENRAGTGLSWSATAYAICANTLPGLVRVEVSSPTNPNGPKSVTSSCPGSRVVSGAGGAIASGPTPRGNVFLQSFIPSSNTAFAVADEDEGGTTAPWLLATYAVCLTA